MTERISAADFMPDDFVIGGLIRHDGRYKAWYMATVTSKDGSGARTVHNRFGSWLVDAPNGTFDEPERAFGPERGRRVKYAIGQRIDKIERTINDALGVTKAPR
jgi:hypothetical protein